MLNVEGVDVLTQGEFVTLMKAMPEGEAGSGTLQAWWMGAEFMPSAIYAALNTEARVALALAGGNPPAEEILERGLARIRQGFPGKFDKQAPRRSAPPPD
jgi:hypothetical protein